MRNLASHFEAVARHRCDVDVRHALDPGVTPASTLLEAVRADLTAALVLRETFDIDLELYGG